MEKEQPSKKELTPEEAEAAAKLEASREARKKAAEEAKAAKVAKAKAKAEQSAAWKQNQQAASANPGAKAQAKGKKEAKVQEKVIVQETPKGEKKILPESMAATYEVHSVEAAWYDWWVQQGFFKPEYVRPGMSQEEHDALGQFVIVIPPPNVTGVLHIGHALTSSVQDTIVRFHRMHRKRVLWVPGMDHAGIATQAVVEKKLAREGINKADIGREKFLEHVWQWKNERGGSICNQLRRMGVSVDWSREVFTMDDRLSRAVKEAFIRFFEKGIIYRANRLVNWSCKLRTCISDIECDDWEIDDKSGREFSIPGHDKDKLYPVGFLWSIAYKLDEEGSDDEIVIATTRPETLMGDTAIAVHPDDERYKKFHNKLFKHPFCKRSIPLVLDKELAKMEFGTGALKVTPAHDPLDYECGVRNNLQFLNILNEDGTMNDQCGEFTGLMRYDCRLKIIERLDEMGLFRGKAKHNMCLKKCSRSGDIIEPIMKPQWWANMEELAKKSMDYFEAKELSILPESPHHQTWKGFMANIRPWCISRQLWWGHRCPAYLVWPKGSSKPSDTTSLDHWVIAHSADEALEKAKTKLKCDDVEIEQDSDVLDTWFSSGLFPFSVMGWPDVNAPDFTKYYPTNFLETGSDILFFWVARMVMMGIELTGRLPFTDVFLHSLVRDARGIKMTKSLGNVIDPIYVIDGITLQGLHDSIKGGNLSPEDYDKAVALQKEYFPEGIKECGTDALRFTLLTYMGAKSINLDTKRIEGYRHFCNKLWNAVKLCLMFFGPKYTPPNSPALTGDESPIDLWILTRLHQTLTGLEEAFKELDFGKFTERLYMFWLYDVCDVYLEACKPVLFFKGELTPEIERAQRGHRATLFTCIDSGLKALHPPMPYITEELWQNIPKRATELAPSLCVADFPQAGDIFCDESTIGEFEFIQQICKSARNLCNTYNMVKKGVTKATINTHTDKARDSVLKYQKLIVTLAYLASVEVVSSQPLPSGCAAQQVNETCDVYLHLEGVDLKKELTRMRTRNKALATDLDNLKARMALPDYHLVPDHIKELNTQKLTAMESELNNLLQALATLERMEADQAVKK